ncbi:MAG: flagellar hook protein FlgE [Pseudomonadota bacterium]|jgi:flagellar hook protein FlgE|nr:flagellar hook protein FlgE [Pseudomonadota bacterium]
MSVNIAVTGLNAAQTDIANTSNNIANVGTIGYRASSTEFGDMYTSSPYTDPSTTVGSGTELLAVKQDFSQGTVTNTGNTLDMALQGAGFFVMQTELDGGSEIYTRAGSFGLDSDGYVVDSGGNFLMAYPVAENGEVLSMENSALQPVSIPLQSGNATATTAIDMSVNLSTTNSGQQAAVPPAAAFDFTDPTTYASSSPISVLDAEGKSLDAMVYYVKTAEPDGVNTETTYTAYLVVEDEILTPADPADAELTFDQFGLQLTGNAPVDYSSANYDLSVDMSGSGLQQNATAVISYAQNGEQVKGLSGLEIDNNGVVYASYGDDLPTAVAQVALANFSNPQGLKPIGSADFTVSTDSGLPIMGQAGKAGFGELRSSALESSNVDLTEELVNLISAQRNYQASAKALETSSGLAQSIINIRN